MTEIEIILSDWLSKANIVFQECVHEILSLSRRFIDSYGLPLSEGEFLLILPISILATSAVIYSVVSRLKPSAEPEPSSDLPQPSHPSNLNKSESYHEPTSSRSFTTGRFAITEKKKNQKYYRILGPKDIAELRKYGVDYYPAPKSWRVPPDLSHLPKEEVWRMFAESYNDMMRPGWRETVEYKTKKAFEWLFN